MSTAKELIKMFVSDEVIFQQKKVASMEKALDGFKNITGCDIWVSMRRELLEVAKKHLAKFKD